MPSVIRSANVGGMVAGSNAIVLNPTYPSYATWPQIIRKEGRDILELFKFNLLDKINEDDTSNPTQRAAETAKPTGAFFSGSVAILIAGIVGFMLLKR